MKRASLIILAILLSLSQISCSPEESVSTTPSDAPESAAPEPDA